MFTVDRAMTLGGAGLATGVAIFAYVAVVQNDGTPRVSGQEHLALFAKPSRPPGETVLALSASSPKGGTAVGSGNFAPPVDYAPTATIAVDAAKSRRVVRVTRDRVFVADREDVSELRRGDVAPGFGRLQDIRLVDGRWSAVFAQEPKPLQSSR